MGSSWRKKTIDPEASDDLSKYLVADWRPANVCQHWPVDMPLPNINWDVRSVWGGVCFKRYLLAVFTWDFQVPDESGADLRPCLIFLWMPVIDLWRIFTELAIQTSLAFVTAWMYYCECIHRSTIIKEHGDDDGGEGIKSMIHWEKQTHRIWHYQILWDMPVSRLWNMRVSNSGDMTVCDPRDMIVLDPWDFPISDPWDMPVSHSWDMIRPYVLRNMSVK